MKRNNTRGTVYRKTVTRPLPTGAELFTRQGQQFARWKPAKGRTRTAKITTGKDGSPRIVEESRTYIAKYRDGLGYVCEVATGCREEDAARSGLSKLERRAELVKSEVMSSAEASTADHQSISIVVHFGAYLNHVRAKGATALHVTDLERKAKKLFRECDISTLRQLPVETVEGWLTARQSEEMSARTRNAHLQAVRGFCKWCVQTKRLTMNPLTTIAKADEKVDRRRQRRAMTEGELVNLLEVARWRPLAEFGRESVPVEANKSAATGERGKRSNWTKAALTLDGLEAAVDCARKHLAGTERHTNRATGTDDRTASADSRLSVAPTVAPTVAPNVAPNLAHSRKKRSLPALSSVDADESREWHASDKKPTNQSKKPCPQCL